MRSLRKLKCIHIKDTHTVPYISMKLEERTPVMSTNAPNMIGRTNPPSPPAKPTTPDTAPILAPKSSEMNLKDRRLADSHGDPYNKQQNREDNGRQANMETARALHRHDGKVGLRIT